MTPQSVQITELDRWDRWISETPDIQNLRIEDLILPGTHNSGVDSEALYTSSFGTCQDYSPFNQLIRGVRVLDLRVEFDPTARTQQERFLLVHHIRSGRNIKRDILDALNSFHQRTGGKELVILDFHTFEHFTPDAHAELATLIKATLGTDALIPAHYRSFTLKQIQSRGPMNTVIAYNRGLRDALFWGGVNQRWKGDFSPSTDALKTFMDSVAQETIPEGELRSIQCAKYNKFPPTPDDFSDKVGQWFASKDINSYIQTFRIINTDWTLRSYIVGNCRHANLIKVAALRPAVQLSPDSSHFVKGIMPGEHRALTIVLRDGQWCREVFFSSSASHNDTIVITSTAQRVTLINGSNLDLNVEHLPLSNGLCFFFIYDGALRRWKLHSPVENPTQSDRHTVHALTSRYPTLAFKMSNRHYSREVLLPANTPEHAVIHAVSSAQLPADIVAPEGARYALRNNDSVVFTLLNSTWQPLNRSTTELMVLSRLSTDNSPLSAAQIKIPRPALSQSGVVALNSGVGPTQLTDRAEEQNFTLLNVSVTGPSGAQTSVKLRASRSIGGCAKSPMNNNQPCPEGSSLFFTLEYHLSDNGSLRMGEYWGEFQLEARDSLDPAWRCPIRVLVRVQGIRMIGP